MPTSNVNKETSHPTEFDYFTPTIPNRIAFDLSLTVHDLRVYMVVNSFAHTTGDAYASNAWIAKKLGITSRSVIRSINTLCKKQYIVREEINGHRHLRIFVNSMRPERQGGVTHVSGGGDTRVRGGCQPCHPINNKIINNKIINNNNIVPIINKKVDLELLGYRDKYMQSDKSNRTDEEFLKQGSHFLDNAGRDKYPFHARLKALKTIIAKGVFEKPAGYDEKKIVKSPFSPEDHASIATYYHVKKHGLKMEDFFPDPKELKKAMQLAEKAQSHKPDLDKRYGLVGFSSI